MKKTKFRVVWVENDGQREFSRMMSKLSAQAMARRLAGSQRTKIVAIETYEVKTLGRVRLIGRKFVKR